MISIDEISPSTWRISMKSPQDRNALGAEMRAALLDALHRAHAAGVKVAIIAGDERAFSSGYRLDPGVMRPKTLTEDRHRLVEVAEFMRDYRAQPVVTIAEVRGYCVAGGTDLMIASDIALAAEDAQIGVPNVRGIGITMLMPVWSWLAGPHRAKLLALSGDLMSGVEADRFGMVAASLPGDELAPRAEQLADRIGRMPHELLEVTKLALNEPWEAAGFDATLVRAAELDALSHGTAPVIDFWDATERDGIKAAVARRDEPFTGPTALEIITRSENAPAMTGATAGATTAQKD